MDRWPSARGGVLGGLAAPEGTTPADAELAAAALEQAARYVDLMVLAEREAGRPVDHQWVARQLGETMVVPDDDSGALLVGALEVLAELDPLQVGQELLDRVIVVARSAGKRSALLERQWLKAAQLVRYCAETGTVEHLLQLLPLLEAWEQLLCCYLEQLARGRSGWRSIATHAEGSGSCSAALAQRLQRRRRDHGPPRGRPLCRQHPIHRHAPPPADEHTRPLFVRSACGGSPPRRGSRHGVT